MNIIFWSYNCSISSRHVVKSMICLMLLVTAFAPELFSQDPAGKNKSYDPENIHEEIYVKTDRNIYIAGEDVWFKVYQLNSLTHAPWGISKVVYLELLDNNNFPVKQLKVKTDGKSGSSAFTLPDNISSGNYVIRAYTSWMKNWPADLFYYMTISVINPFESVDHIKLPPGRTNADSLSADSGIQSAGKSPGIVAGKSLQDAGKQIVFTIKQEKTEYASREKAKITISAADDHGVPLEADLSVSVVKKVTVKGNEQDSHNNPMQSSSPGRDSIPLFLPELEGNLISGFIRMKSTDEPIRNIDIVLSYVGKAARCQFCKTDKNGMFNFLSKETGIREIVIQPLSSEITGYYIELIQPFSNSFSNFRPGPFYLDSSLIKGINNAVISMQINNIYEPFRQPAEALPENEAPDFYGKPENTIKMSDYIELTSLREVVKEIIPNVYTLKQNGKYEFRLINKFRGQPFENKPLVLVDGVPAYDFEKVLAIDSKEIERADIINTRYFYSDDVFDGILSFITKKGNLSSMEFDNSIFRQVYESCQGQKVFYSPEYSSGELKNSRIPDFRNTLYWAPDLHTTKEGKAGAEFFTSDEPGEYTIVVEGITSDGKKGIATGLLRIK